MDDIISYDDPHSMGVLNLKKAIKERIKELENSKFSQRELTKMRKLSNLDQDSLGQLLHQVRRSFYNQKEYPTDVGLKIDFRSDEPISLPTQEKYKVLTKEEQDHFNEFIKNFVYDKNGEGQFLYVKVGNV